MKMLRIMKISFSPGFRLMPEILKDKDPYYRVLDLSTDPYKRCHAGIFSQTCRRLSILPKMEAYQDLIDEQMSGKFNAQVLDMLNTKYIIIGGQKIA